MMDKQQEQTKQSSNQEVEYTSGFLNEDEEVNESDFDDLTEEQEAGKLADNQQNKLEEEEQPKKKAKRPRKTLEQEIAELDAKRERLMEKKRRQEAHEKIIFGATVINLLKNLINKKDPLGTKIIDKISSFIDENNRDKKIILSIINKINNNL